MMTAAYSEALYSLAAQEGLAESILQQLEVLQQSFEENPDYIRLLSTPNLPKAQRCSLLDEALGGKVEPYLLNILKILTEKGYMPQFSGCCREYRRLFDRDHDILEVTMVSAKALSQDQTERLRQALSQRTGKKIRLLSRVDPAAMGGLRLEYDGLRLDGTLRTHLDSIGSLLKNTVI